MSDAPLSVGLAHHWMVSMRGGEKVLAVLAEAFPEAPIYTLLARPENLVPQITSRRIVSSWLQRFARVKDLQRRALPALFPAAWSLDATGHDVLISSDAASIKAVRVRPDALHLCYCYSPMRYVWDLYDTYRAAAGPVGRMGLRLMARPTRWLDRRAAANVTAFVAISHCVADRIARSYSRPSIVIPPPVETDEPPNLGKPEDFYLVVGEHVFYKRNDLAIDACNRLGRRLIVIGAGPKLEEMQRRAGPTVEVLGWQSDEVVRDHMRRCRALLFCGQEDFGLVPVEAQAAGRPVIAYASGGALETVVEGKSGFFFRNQSPEDVADAIGRFETTPLAWSSEEIQRHARWFGVERFRERFLHFYDWCLERYSAGGAPAVREAVAALDREAFLDRSLLPTDAARSGGGGLSPSASP